MADQKKDESIIELTEVIEEAHNSGAGGWMETTPPPSPGKKIAEPPKAAKKVSPINAEDLKGIPDSPLKKFLLAEEEPAPPPEAPGGSRPLGFSQPSPQPPRPIPEPPRRAPEPARTPTEPPPAAAAAPRPSLPNLEAEMKAIREASLARVEKWTAQEGGQVVERVAREISPRIAEDVIRREIEKPKAEAEEKMVARMEKWATEEGVRVLERVAREIFPRIAEDMIRKEIEKLKAEAEEKG